jgi:hypothetical protein
MIRAPAGLCSVCGLSGFAEASMSFTEAGSTCPHCYLKWQETQRQQMLADAREASRWVHRELRWLMIAGAIVALLVVIAANWKNCGHLTAPP